MREMKINPMAFVGTVEMKLVVNEYDHIDFIVLKHINRCMRRILKRHQLNDISKELTIDYIQQVVCKYYNMSIEQLHANTRKRESVQPRQVAMYFSKNLTKSSLSTIGKAIGDKDHATVLHAFKTVNNLIDTDRLICRQIEEIEKKLKP